MYSFMIKIVKSYEYHLDTYNWWNVLVSSECMHEYTRYISTFQSKEKKLCSIVNSEKGCNEVNWDISYELRMIAIICE
jgi:hypothetical protein